MEKNTFQTEAEEGEKKESEETFRLPKNVRQIGIIDKNSRIYIEDYVVTYLKRFRTEQKSGFGAAALYGRVVYQNEMKYVFVAGAAYRELSETYEDGPSEDMLLYYKECGQAYFQEYKPVGIAVIHAGNIRIPIRWHQKMNLSGLLGRGEVFIDMNTEEEDTVYSFIHDDGVEIKEGHYIYYDRNEAMQNFLVDWHGKDHIHESEDVRDEVVSENCRMVMGEKKESRRMSAFTFCTSAGSIILLAGMCAAGVYMMQHYEHAQETASSKMQISTVSQEEALNKVSAMELLGSDVSDEETAMTLEEFTWKQSAREADEKETMNSETVSAAVVKTNEASAENEESLPAMSSREEVSPEPVSQEEVTSGPVSQEEVTSEPVSQEEVTSEPVSQEEVTSGPVSQEEVTPEQISREEVSTERNSKEEPAEETASKPATQKDYFSYTIRKGDTLYEICMKKYGSISYLNDICRRNEIEDQNSIYYGQIIELPDK